MKARIVALIIPESGRYFVVDLPALRQRSIDEVTTALAKLKDQAEKRALEEVVEDAVPALGMMAAALDVDQAEARTPEPDPELVKKLLERLTRLTARSPRDVHHFRLPVPSRLEWLMQLQELRSSAGGRTELHAALVGCMWSHRTRELASTWPTDPTVPALVAYSEAVQSELLDGGYSEAEIAILGDRCLTALNARTLDGAEIRKIADFT